MPIEFDPEWEYYVPSTEWLEAFEDEDKINEFDRLVPNYINKHDKISAGVRFGRGNPDYYKPTIAYAKYSKTTIEIPPVDCIWCGFNFRARSISTRYCSTQCQTEHKKSKQVFKSVTCKNCDKQFSVLENSNRKYCSKNCFEIHQQSIIHWLTCEYCNNAFRSSRGNIKYCSRYCYSEYRRLNTTVRIETNCKHCQRQFTKQNGSGNYFCSRQCFYQHPRPSRKNANTCKHCNAQFYGSRRSKYCSLSCWVKHIEVSFKTCKLCGKLFKPKANRTQFCSTKCGHKGWVRQKRLLPKFCLKCHKQFQPSRLTRMYCSKRCLPGAIKVLPLELNCHKCHKTFKPLYTNHKFCSRKCGSYLGAPQGPSDDKLDKFRRLYMSGMAMKTMCAQFGVQLACLKKWKKKLGLESRKPGRPSGTISPK